MPAWHSQWPCEFRILNGLYIFPTLYASFKYNQSWIGFWNIQSIPIWVNVLNSINRIYLNRVFWCYIIPNQHSRFHIVYKLIGPKKAYRYTRLSYIGSLLISTRVTVSPRNSVQYWQSVAYRGFPMFLSKIQISIIVSKKIKDSFIL